MRWRKITGIDFPVLADQHLQFVSNLQFKQSVYQLCGTDIVHKVGAVYDAAVVLS